MSQPATSPNHDSVRKLLLEALALAESRGSLPVHGAQFKPLMKELSPGFDERPLGYRTLRKLLDAHPDVVSVGHDGVDIVVARPNSGPRDAAAATPPAGRAVPQVPAVRPDFWRAFTLIDPALQRFFRRKTGTAFIVSREPVPDDPLRAQIQESPNDFVEIEPISSEDRLGRHRAFAAGVRDKSARAELEVALREPLWFQAFMGAVRQYPSEELAWKVAWTDYVVSRIRQWAAERKVEIPEGLVRYRPASPPTVSGQLGTPSAAVRGLAETNPQRGTVRARVLAALGRMPTVELLRLPIPAHYLIEGLD